MKEYIDYISQLAANKINKEFANCDEAHALEVLIRIFKESQTNVRIFAANLCSDVPNNPKYIETLSDFIERGGTLKILLNNFDTDKIKDSGLMKRLAFYQTKNDCILIKQTDVKPYFAEDKDKKEVHFTIGDDCSYRIETDTIKRTADCNFNNAPSAEPLITFFDDIFEKATDINLKNIFNLN